MKKAEEMCRAEYDDHRSENIFMERQVNMKWAIFMMKNYAREAIKADRKNVAKHAKAMTQSNGEWVSASVDAKVIPSTIINAPEIELL